MKQFCAVLAFCLLFAYPAAASDPFSIRTSLSYPQNFVPVAIPAQMGETLAFSSEDLERRLGIAHGSLEGITLTALPDRSSGAVLLDGVEAEAYDYLTRAEVDRLCFRPEPGAAFAVVTFVPRGGAPVTASLQISILQQIAPPPEIEGISLETLRNIPISGYIPVTDHGSGGVAVRVVRQPQKGLVRISDQSFIYEPFSGITGRDIFTVLAVDSSGSLSQEAAVSVSIGKTRTDFSYADMTGHPSHYAAIQLHNHGVMSGRKIGDTWLFDPDTQMSRANFLILAVTAAGLRVSPTVNTGLENDASIPIWLKPYVKAGLDAGMISPNYGFNFRGVPTRAEAVLMTERAANIRDVKDFAITVTDRGDIPDWAQASYKNLTAHRMLGIHDGRAAPNAALTNSYAAELAWQLYSRRK
ncbi:MAG: hypothetical protein FWH02_07215 [Oscillospiraceae bacterium]|nr:hypothetical protein [Oscillospiraceae bacterium]